MSQSLTNGQNEPNGEGRTQIRQVRSGTVNEGYEYEKLIPAYFALKLLLDPTVKSFDFELNSRSFRKFDDLILTVTKSDNTEEKFAIQLKHRDEEHRRLKANDEFNKRKSNFKEKGFNISQFLKAYAVEDKAIRESYKFVLFTNVEFVGLDEVRNYVVKEVKNAFGTDLFNVDGTYQFKEQYAREFCRNFFLISAQKSVNEVHNSIVEIFSKEFHSDEQTAIYYINFFQQLRNNNYTNTRITRDSVVLNLTKFLASRSFIAPPLTSEDDPKVGLVENAIKNFDSTVLEDVDKEFVKKYWKSVVTRTTDQDTTLARELKFLQKNEIFPKRMSPIVVSIIMNKPLFLEVNTNNEEVVYTVVLLLKTLEDFKLNVVLVGRVVPKSRFPNFNTFESLTDLKPFKSLYNSFIQTIKVSFQGRESQTLQFIKSYVKIDQLITSSEIFKSLQGDLHFGEDIEDLPQFFIPRTLLKSDVNLDQLKMISTQISTMVHCGGNSKEFRSFLQDKAFDFDNCKLILTDDEDYHDGHYHLTLTDDDTLAWIPREIDTQSSTIFDNSLNLLSGGTGVGKTTMMKYLAQNCPVGYWVSRVPMQQMGSVFKKVNDIDDVLEQLLVNTKRSKVDDRVCEYFRQTGRILFLFDGLNELNSNAIREALGVIKRIAQMGYKIWISGNRNLPELLDGTDFFYSYTVEDLNVEDQKNYVWNRLQSGEVGEDTIKKIFQKLFEEREKQEDILKLPLTLYILTDNFRRNEDLTNWEKLITLHQMYSTFVEGQLQHNLEKIGINKLKNSNVLQLVEGFKCHQFKGYQVAALQTCLEPDLFRKLNIKMEKTFLDSIKLNGDLMGLVKVNKDDSFTFSHRTFGEYFAAMWFNDNFFELALEDCCWIFREEYEGIRRFFDAKLAEDCPLHLAVLDQDLTKVKVYAEAHCNDLDKGGRTALHLAASMGWQHNILDEKRKDYIWYKRPNKSSSKSEEILKFLLGFNTVLTPDRLFGWNCFEYADGSLCLDSLEELSKKQELKWKYLRLYQQHVFSLSYYSTTMGYTNLLELTLKIVNSELLNEMHQKKPLLHLGVMSHQESVVKLLISNGFSLSQLDFQKKTPLHEAATSGHLASVKLFLAEGVNLDPEDFLGCTPLHLAAKIGNYDIVKFLVETGAKIDAVDKQNKTPLLKAAYTGRTEIVKFLVGNGADINAQTIDRVTPLHRAAEMGHYGTVRYLVETGAEIDAKEKYQRTPLHYAAYEGHLDVVEYLLEQGSDISARDEDKNTPRHIAEKKKHQKVVELLVVAEKKHFSRDSTDVKESDLHKAAQQKNLKRVQELLEGGADIEERNHLGETLLHVAGFEGDFSMVKFLLSKNANTAATSKDGRVPLHLACHGGHLQVVQELLNKGQNSALDNWKLEPIHRAAYKGHKKIVEVLIEAGVDINTTSGEGLTPLHSSAYGGHVDLMEWLLENGADIERKQKKKETCLHVAVQKGWTKCVDFLIQKKRDFIDEVDSLGRTALHLAAQRNSFDLVELLVRAGADVDKVDYCGKTALDVAEDAGREKIVKYLKKYQ